MCAVSDFFWLTTYTVDLELIWFCIAFCPLWGTHFKTVFFFFLIIQGFWELIWEKFFCLQNSDQRGTWSSMGTRKLVASLNLATWCKELTHWKRPWCWERLKAGGEGDDRGWDGWMASPTLWTCVWVWELSCGSWWWTGKPGMLQSMGLQRVGHDQVTELEPSKDVF